jgi:xanthine/uracil permease
MSAAPSLERHRPKAIMVIAAFLFAATIVALVVGESLLFPNTLLDKLWKFNPEGAALFHSIGRLSGVFLLALGVGTFFAALGLLRGQRWAWWFGVVLFAIDACGDIISYLLTHNALRSLSGAIVSGTFLFFLCRDSVRGYFLRKALTPNHRP